MYIDERAREYQVYAVCSGGEAFPRTFSDDVRIGECPLVAGAAVLEISLSSVRVSEARLV